MDANELTFGIEIETTIPAGACQVGSYHYAASGDSAGLPSGWQAKSDGSIVAGRGRIGCEFVSPVLKGSDGIRQVIAVLKRLAELGASVNQSTGFHVHVGWNGNADALKRLVTLVANFETAIFASTGTKNREQGQWCASVQRHGNADVANRVAGSNRYHVLNLTNLRPGGKQTVEFRAFAGTLNATKVIGYIQLCLGLVERAHKAKRVTNWAAKPVKATSPIHRSGAGQTALTRLFYQLGWIKGRTDYRYGTVITDGSPSEAKIRKELMRLAKKYDSE